MENEKQNQPSQNIRPISWNERWGAYRAFIGTMWRANPALAFVRFFLIFVSAVMQPIQVYVFSLLIDAIGSGAVDRAPQLIGFAIGSFVIQRVSNDIAHSWLDSWFARAVTLKASDEIYSHIARIPPETLTDPNVRRDLDYAREDLWRINNLPMHTEGFIRSTIQIIGAVTLGFLAPWWVLLLVLGISLLQAWNAQGESKRDVWNATWNTYDGRQIEYVRYLFLLGEDFRELRLLGAAERVLGNFRAASKRVIARFRTVGLKSAYSRGLLALLQGFAYAAIVVSLAPPAFQDASRLATLYIALNLFSLLGDSLDHLAKAFGNLSADLSILARVRNLLNFPIEDNTGRSIPKQPIKIEFRDVTYRYRGAKKEALSHVNLVIQEGEHLAVVGENGAGKSTFLRLLAGLDRPTTGTILINGKPLNDYKPEEWRRAFHLMLQDAKLFQDYLEENLHYGEGRGKWKRAGFPLVKSLNIAGADAVVREIKNGLGAFIGDWVAPPGVVPAKVSGGQSQRLVISRTLVHGGRFICFDEPTSAMDALAETAFFERLHSALKGRGIIYISHRFSTVRRATRILVFDAGQLIEDGSHEDLLLNGGRYAELYQEQARWYQ